MKLPTRDQLLPFATAISNAANLAANGYWQAALPAIAKAERGRNPLGFPFHDSRRSSFVLQGWPRQVESLVIGLMKKLNMILQTSGLESLSVTDHIDPALALNPLAFPLADWQQLRSEARILLGLLEGKR